MHVGHIVSVFLKITDSRRLVSSVLKESTTLEVNTRKKMNDLAFTLLLGKIANESAALDFFESSRREWGWTDFTGHIVLYRSLGFIDYINVFCNRYPNLKVRATDLLITDDSAAENLLNEHKNQLLGNAAGNRVVNGNLPGYSKIYSFYGFHFDSDIIKEFCKLYVMLRKGGDAAILFLVESPFFHFLREIYEHPVWGKYLKNKSSHIPEWFIWKDVDVVKYYIKHLQRIGFLVVKCEQDASVISFQNDKDCK
ncbi:hypothetical protein NPIL_124341, partial [Nephila pilipes]